MTKGVAGMEGAEKKVPKINYEGMDSVLRVMHVSCVATMTDSK